MLKKTKIIIGTIFGILVIFLLWMFIFGRIVLTPPKYIGRFEVVYNMSGKDFSFLPVYADGPYELQGLINASMVRALYSKNVSIFKKAESFTSCCRSLFFKDDADNVYIFSLPYITPHPFDYKEDELEKIIFFHRDWGDAFELSQTDSYYTAFLGKNPKSFEMPISYISVLAPDMKIYILKANIKDLNAFFRDPDWFDKVKADQPPVRFGFPCSPILQLTPEEVKKIKAAYPDENFDWLSNIKPPDDKRPEILLKKYEDLKKHAEGTPYLEKLNFQKD